MAATATKDKQDDRQQKASKAKDKDKAAKEKERAAKQKEKDRAAKQKEKDRAAKQKEKDRAAKQKEKDRAAKQKEKDRGAKQKDKERAAERKDRKRARKEAESGASGTAQGATDQSDTDAVPEDVPGAADTADAGGGDSSLDDDVVQPVEEAAAPERGKAEEVPADRREPSPAAQLEPLPDNDSTVRPKGYIAEALGKEDGVERSTQRATLAASYTTRDHEVIRAWAESRGGRPADVEGTGDRGAGVLRIEFPDGPGDDSKLEGVDWDAFFATFDDSDVDFLYQERVRTGEISRFHKFVRAGDSDS